MELRTYAGAGFLLLHGSGDQTPVSGKQRSAPSGHQASPEFFNTHPYVAAPVLGVTLAMEEQRANGAEIDDGAINGIKVGLMGPLAGVGDPIFWGTVRPVFAALGAGIAMSGSLLGPLLFFILFNAVRLLTRYYGVAYGYRKGVDIVKDMGGGFLQKLTEGRQSSACLSWGHWLTSGRT